MAARIPPATRDPLVREGGVWAWMTGIGLLVVAGIIQASDLAVWGGVRVDLTLVLAVSWGLVSGPRGGFAYGVVSGLVADLLVGQSIMYTLLRAMLGVVAGLARPMLNVQQPMVILPLLLLASMIQDLAVVAWLGSWTRWAALWPWRIAADLLVAVPVFVVVRRLWAPAGNWAMGGRRG